MKMNLIEFKNYINSLGANTYKFTIIGLDDSVTELTAESRYCMAFYNNKAVVHLNDTCAIRFNNVQYVDAPEYGSPSFVIVTKGEGGKVYETKLKVVKNE